MTTLTVEQAYAAMYFFLEQYYEKTQADDVGALLGSMSLLADEQPVDHAIDKDWGEAVRFAVNGGKAGRLMPATKK